MMGEGPAGRRQGGAERSGAMNDESSDQSRRERRSRPTSSSLANGEDKETMREEYEKYLASENGDLQGGGGERERPPPTQREKSRQEMSYDEDFDYEAMREELKDFESFGDEEEEEEEEDEDY
jgi:hypothetical protein